MTTGFDDNGQPVSVWQPPPPDPLLDLLENLEDAGATFADRGAALRILEAAFDKAGDVRGGEALGMIFSRLPGGRKGTELRHALGLALDESEAECARRLGVSRQGFSLSVKRLRGRLLRKTDDGEAIGRGQ